ncbi:hypothetical protein BHM03_00029543 [Ensete ventricosum]|nr:hypothetical protein BHM03_00029543 [Ensete ventricosum]
MSAAGAAAAYLGRRAAQKERVRLLYRRALKDTLNWTVNRHHFYKHVPSPSPPPPLSFSIRSALYCASDLREKFEANKHAFLGLLVAANSAETLLHQLG